MATPHPHLDPDDSLARLRQYSAEYERGGTQLNVVEHIVDELRSLDLHLCNGGALPGDWQSVDLHRPSLPREARNAPIT